MWSRMSFSFLGPGWWKEVWEMREKCAWEVLDGSALCLVSLTLHFLRATLCKRVNTQRLTTSWARKCWSKVHNWWTCTCWLVGTQEGMYPAQPFSHLREFVGGDFCSYCLVVLNTLAEAERQQHIVFDVEKTCWKKNGPKHLGCKCFCPWQTSCQE